MARRLAARKSAAYKAVSTAPSINKTPVGSTTPPLPYPVSKDLSSSLGTVAHVRFNGDPAYVLDRSTQPSCVGDAAGSCGGVKSGTVGGEVKPVQGSSTVRIDGQRLVRQGDPCTLNKGNCPGLYVTGDAPTGGVFNGAPDGDTNPPLVPQTPAEKSWWQTASPWVHGSLGVASFVPGLSVASGALDAAIYAVEGQAVEAGLAAASIIPGGKVVTSVGKVAAKANEVAKGAKAADAAVDATRALKAGGETADAARAGKAVEEAHTAGQSGVKAERATPQPASGGGGKKGGDGGKVKGNNKEKSRCGEWLARMDMAHQGFDEIVAVQNKSGHGVDLVGRNSATGEVKVWEVKTTSGTQAPSLSKQQAELGGSLFSASRLDRASRGLGNYGRVPEAMKNAEKARDWIENAQGAVGYERREVFVDDLEKGCMKHPARPSRSKPWDPKLPTATP